KDIHMSQMDETVQIENAAHWENHSFVRVRDEFLAEDEAWITNQIVKVQKSGNAKAEVETCPGDSNIYKVQRMVIEGVVAVRLRNGRVKTINLPVNAGKLLASDLNYIVSKIDEMN